MLKGVAMDIVQIASKYCMPTHSGVYADIINNILYMIIQKSEIKINCTIRKKIYY